MKLVSASKAWQVAEEHNSHKYINIIIILLLSLVNESQTTLPYIYTLNALDFCPNSGPLI
jgi:hypothetical protein